MREMGEPTLFNIDEFFEGENIHGFRRTDSAE
jgi:hypothetical protein